MAGFAMGGPVGALVGAALGHAADEGMVGNIAGRALPFDAARVSASPARRAATAELAAKAIPSP